MESRRGGWARALVIGRRLRPEPALLSATLGARRGRQAHARLAGSWLVARGDLLVIVRPVLETGPKSRATCCAASSLGVVLQGRRPQVGVIHVALRSVREEFAVRPHGVGCWLEEGWRRVSKAPAVVPEVGAVVPVIGQKQVEPVLYRPCTA